MKKLLLFMLLCLPLVATAQTEPKYLAGAITLNDDNDVAFTTEINAPTLSKQDIYDTILKWANTRFQPEGKFHARVLYTNEADGTIAVGGEEYLVFLHTALALDRSRIYYQLRITCETGKCKAEMSRIRYWYDEERDGGEKYTAEEWITDKVALNKSKTKLAPIAGKFRRKTIDLKDELFKLMQDALSNRLLNNTQMAAASEKPASEKASANTVVTLTAPVTPPTPVVTVVTPSVETPQAEATPAPQAEVKTSDEETLIRSAVRMTITAGNDEQFELSKECWGGFGELFGKNVAFCLIDTQKTMGNLLLSQSDTYTVSFYQAGSSTPSVTVKCKKLMAQTVSGEEAQKMSASSDKQKSYNMYVGEVIR